MHLERFTRTPLSILNGAAGVIPRWGSVTNCGRRIPGCRALGEVRLMGDDSTKVAPCLTTPEGELHRSSVASHMAWSAGENFSIFVRRGIGPSKFASYAARRDSARSPRSVSRVSNKGRVGINTLSAQSAETGIRSADVAGGANTSHTIAVELLDRLLSAVPPGATADEYIKFAVDGNVLGKATTEGRRRALRHLRELYVLDPARVLFRALRDLWNEDAAAQPLLAGLCAFARDSVFRASGVAVMSLAPGASVTPRLLSDAVVDRFPDSYSTSTAAKIGRNTASSWAQTGHLIGKIRKVRAVADARPASAALAVLLGHLEGVRGQALFNTRWARFLDRDQHEVERLTKEASARGYLEMRSSGGVIDIGFRQLLRPFDPEAGR
jgi:hypothetical protein